MSEGGDFLARIVGALEQAQIPHMVAGSFASTHHGVPRTTHDIDLVIDPTIEALRAFVASLPSDAYYVNEEASIDALRRRSTRARLIGTDVFVATPEDTILSKLEWSLMSGSERQLRDVAGVVEVKGDALDVGYIERWAEEIGVLDLWRRVIASMGP